jgi:hypothetical protein
MLPYASRHGLLFDGASDLAIGGDERLFLSGAGNLVVVLDPSAIAPASTGKDKKNEGNDADDTDGDSSTQGDFGSPAETTGAR